MINIELENEMNSISNLLKRARYYNAMVTGKFGLGPNQLYSQLKPIISIFLVTKKFKENKGTNIIITPEQVSADYMFNGEITILLSTRNMSKIEKDVNYDRLVEMLKIRKEDYSVFLKTAVSILQGKMIDEEAVTKTNNNIMSEKINNVYKGVTGMNLFLKHREEGELTGDLKGKLKWRIIAMRDDFDLPLEKVEEMIKNKDSAYYEENKELITKIYNDKNINFK